MDVGSNMCCKGMKLKLLPRTFSPWNFNQFEWYILMNISNNAECHWWADSVCPTQPFPLGRWVPGCTAFSPLCLWEGKENPSHEKCKERITNIRTVGVSCNTGELCLSWMFKLKEVFNCQFSVISLISKIDVYGKISTVPWGSFAYKIYLPPTVEKQPELFLSKRNGMGKEIANVSAEEELVFYDTDKKKRQIPFRKHFLSYDKFYSDISKMNNFFLVPCQGSHLSAVRILSNWCLILSPDSI